ncbi:MAG: AMP-binding protein, partial [Gemmatimonadetes bacterium]|nr:AMP-binding protein [Gemmatimonadota bacterium]
MTVPGTGSTTVDRGSARTLPGRLLAQAAARPEDTALREKVLGIWHSITWSEYAARVARFALGLRSVGLETGDRIAIVGDNR